MKNLLNRITRTHDTHLRFGLLFKTVLCSVVLLIPYSVDLDSHKLVFINIYLIFYFVDKYFQDSTSQRIIQSLSKQGK